MSVSRTILATPFSDSLWGPTRHGAMTEERGHRLSKAALSVVVPSPVGSPLVRHARPREAIAFGLLRSDTPGVSAVQAYASSLLHTAASNIENFANRQITALADNRGNSVGTACWVAPRILLIASHIGIPGPLYCQGRLLTGHVRQMGDVLFIRTDFDGPVSGGSYAKVTSVEPLAGDPLYMVYNKEGRVIVQEGVAVGKGYAYQSMTHIGGEPGASGGIVLNHRGEMVSLHLGRREGEKYLRLQIPFREILAQERRLFGKSWLEDPLHPGMGRYAWPGGTIDGVLEGKRRDLEAELRRLGWCFLREGGSHQIWTNLKGSTQPVPRHTEIAEGTYRSIVRKAQDNPGDGADIRRL